MDSTGLPVHQTRDQLWWAIGRNRLGKKDKKVIKSCTVHIFANFSGRPAKMGAVRSNVQVLATLLKIYGGASQHLTFLVGQRLDFKVVF